MTDAVTLTADVTVAWLSNSNTRVGAEDVSTFLKEMHQTFADLRAPALSGGNTAEATRSDVGAVTARNSLAIPGHIISMIDGKPYGMLGRHLCKHGLTPNDYRARYGLKPDYPMVAPDYSDVRRALARKGRLGGKPGETEDARAAARGKAEPAKAPARQQGVTAAKKADQALPEGESV